MSFGEIFLIAVSLSMDAFAVSVGKGLSLKKISAGPCLTAGLYFGIAQAVMPLLGYYLAGTVAAGITRYAFWISFALLLLIGGRMIVEAVRGKEKEMNGFFSFPIMLPLAVATSIDALAIGISFALLEIRILPAVLLIGITTFAISAIGVRIGHLIGLSFRRAASILGGAVLILIGIKLLFEGLGVL